jgi:hypothetical protein
MQQHVAPVVSGLAVADKHESDHLVLPWRPASRPQAQICTGRRLRLRILFFGIKINAISEWPYDVPDE